MKIQSISKARVIWLVPTISFNPHGVSLNPAVSKIVERYSFAKFPALEKLYGPNKESPVFEGGEFVTEHGKNIEVSITIHNDGLVADSRLSTDATDSFLVDMMTWLSEEFGTIAPQNLLIKKVYSSEIFFKLEKKPKFLNEELASLAENSSALIEESGFGNFDFVGVTLGTNPQNSKSPVTFRIERELNTPFSENRYYSGGPFTTSDHIALIQKFEDLL